MLLHVFCMLVWSQSLRQVCMKCQFAAWSLASTVPDEVCFFTCRSSSKAAALAALGEGIAGAAGDIRTLSYAHVVVRYIPVEIISHMSLMLRQWRMYSCWTALLRQILSRRYLNGCFRVCLISLSQPKCTVIHHWPCIGLSFRMPFVHACNLDSLRRFHSINPCSLSAWYYPHHYPGKWPLPSM